jgi:hypothetical protein
MQAPRATPDPSNAATATNTPCKPLETIQGLTRFEKDVDETTSLYFEDIVQRLKGPLLVSLRKSKKNFRPFAIRLLVLGQDESSAKPYIVVFCPLCITGLVRKYFSMNASQRLCQPGKAGPASFEVIVEGKPIQPTTSEHLYPISIRTGCPVGGHQRYRNIPLRIDGIGGTRYATMGGYIVITDKNETASIYGLTAGHSIVQDDLEEEVPSERASEEPNAERNLFPELTTFAFSHFLEPATNRTTRNATNNVTAHSREVTEWSGTANVAPASFSTQACDRDWALLEAVMERSNNGTQEEKMFERYRLGDPGSGTVLIGDDAERSLQPPCIGKISRLPSFAILSYGSDFVRVHTIPMRDAYSRWLPITYR